MKPSERIEAIKQEAISKDWVLFGGNNYTSVEWDMICRGNPRYLLDAIVAYLDEQHEINSPSSTEERGDKE